MEVNVVVRNSSGQKKWVIWNEIILCCVVTVVSFMLSEKDRRRLCR